MSELDNKSIYLSVTDLNNYISKKFEVDPYLDNVYLQGEIGNLKKRTGRHKYFNLKDPENGTMISAMIWESVANSLSFELKEGMKVNVVGKVKVYKPYGTFSIQIEKIIPEGIGELTIALKQLTEKLKQEGLFDLGKKEIPKFPKKIAVVTSASGSVIEDIVKTVQRRNDLIQVILYPASVQGLGAADEMIQQIKRIEKEDFDLLIIGRGGGSVEDLWEFNNEELVRKIASLEIPVISSVGHETDNTLIDFVADQRASTPTAAAELATEITKKQIAEFLLHSKESLLHNLTKEINKHEQMLTSIKKSNIMQNPKRLYHAYENNIAVYKNKIIEKFKYILEINQLKVDGYQQSLLKNSQTLFWRKETEFQKQVEKLNMLSPLNVITRGYSIVKTADKLVKSKADTNIGDDLEIINTDSIIKAKVIEINDRENI